ncbi:ImmA/IrrE family metallo-endopeptidase [Tetragenococcus halophilus]
MNSIHQLVKDLISMTGETNPKKICNHFDVQILSLDLGNTFGFKTNWQDISIIYVNSLLPDSTQQFIIAHELGHILLHKGLNMPFFSFPSKNSIIPKVEAEANRFAIVLTLFDYFQQNENLLYTSTERTIAQIGLPKQLNYLLFDIIEQYKTI